MRRKIPLGLNKYWHKAGRPPVVWRILGGIMAYICWALRRAYTDGEMVRSQLRGFCVIRIPPFWHQFLGR